MSVLWISRSQKVSPFNLFHQYFPARQNRGQTGIPLLHFRLCPTSAPWPVRPPYGTTLWYTCFSCFFFFFLRYQPATRKPPTALSTCIIELYCFAAGMGLSNARTRLIRVALAEKRRGIRSGDGSNNSTNSDRLTGVGLDTGWTAGGAAGGGLVFLLRNPVVSNALELLWWRNMKWNETKGVPGMMQNWRREDVRLRHEDEAWRWDNSEWREGCSMRRRGEIRAKTTGVPHCS